MRRVLPCALILVGVLLATLPLRAEEPLTEPAPTPQADAAKIERLVEELGSSDFATRELASRELLALGEKARPALEQTMKASENMEARWRAEQILRRMDRQGKHPVGQGDEPLRPRSDRGMAPPGVPPGAPPQPPSGMDEIERRMAEIRRRFFDGFGPGRMGDFGPRSQRLEAPGLRLDAEVFAGMLVQVTLLDREEPRAYRGRTLEDILQRSPELEKLVGMAELKEKWAGFKRANPSLFRGGFGRLMPGGVLPGGGFSFSQSGEGIEVVQGPDGVTVRIREKDENGVEQVRELKGATLDEIREKHPELREKLDQFGGVRIQLGPVQIFRDRMRRPGLPVPVAPPKTEVTPGPDDDTPAIFGVYIVAPEPVLAVHLGLEPGHGALVTQVIPGTQAAAMGLERFDVVVAVNGEPVTDYGQAAQLLRKAGKDRSPLSLDLIRRGARKTLER